MYYGALESVQSTMRMKVSTIVSRNEPKNPAGKGLTLGETRGSQPHKV